MVIKSNGVTFENIAQYDPDLVPASADIFATNVKNELDNGTYNIYCRNYTRSDGSSQVDWIAVRVDNAYNFVKEQARNLGKREMQEIVVDGERFFAMGTDLVYEDIIYDAVINAFKTMCEILHKEFDYDEFTDDISAVRDEVVDRTVKNFKGEIVYGSNEY